MHELRDFPDQFQFDPAIRRQNEDTQKKAWLINIGPILEQYKWLQTIEGEMKVDLGGLEEKMKRLEGLHQEFYKQTNDMITERWNFRIMKD